MSFFHAVTEIFASLALSRKYAFLFSLSEGELAARGLRRDRLGASYIAELDRLQQPKAARGRIAAGTHQAA